VSSKSRAAGITITTSTTTERRKVFFGHILPPKGRIHLYRDRASAFDEVPTKVDAAWADTVEL
jgi:hypothetical protein